MLAHLAEHKVLLAQELVCDEERAQLQALALRMHRSGMLTPNGPGRQYKVLSEPDALLDALAARLEAFFCLEGLDPSPTLPCTLSVITQGGAIQAHCDAYPREGALHGCGHIRANIAVQMEHESAWPCIARSHDQAPAPVQVQQGGAWCFMASHSKHSTAHLMIGPRVVLGFGWVLPAAMVPDALCTHEATVVPSMEQFAQQVG
eukprot:TRINITY_DN17499_c0_g2_i3.p2 TRINITY_DN17499_c0_g2~~TRINITY_DN17499_c0_g2_i3.p2  ORF type:complete len:204 (+),score=52.53 TRINITY_DN17499_c0_g2_i3:175-786(+)